MLKQLIRDSYNHYANKHMRKQWIRNTYKMMTKGTHQLSGRVPRKVI